MPSSTPFREIVAAQGTLFQEKFIPPCKLIQENGLYIPFYNGGDTTYIAGEPILYFGRVCIVQRTILPGKMGTLITDWIVEARLAAAAGANTLNGAINQNDLVYWNRDGSYQINSDGDYSDDFGAAQESAPTHGFILGRACLIYEETPRASRIDGSDYIAALDASSELTVRVASLPGATTTYGSVS